MRRAAAVRGPGSYDALKIVHVSLNKLKPADYNPRTMPEEELAKLERSIERFGLVEPIVVRTKGNIVIGGHQRLEAARRLGYRTVPVVFVDVSEDEAKQLNLALNKIQGGWDTMRLAALLSELRILPTAELEVTGFLRAEASAIIRALDWSRRPSPDDLPEPPEVPTAKPGDVWALGDHSLVCSDCADTQAVNRLLSGKSIDLVVTDPPYGVDYDPGARPGSRTRSRKMAGDCLPNEDYRALLERCLEIAFDAASPGTPAYLFHASTQAETVLAAFRTAGWRLAACLIWVKPAPTFGRGDYAWQHEPVAYGWKPGGRHRWYGGRSQSTVWQFERESVLPDQNGPEHPTVKPVSLLQRMISNSSRPGAVVYDPFLGSGSTLIACERLGRRCLGVEIDARFVDTAIRRWERYTGSKAELAEEV